MDQKRAKFWFYYSPKVGLLSWRKTRDANNRAGRKAGNPVGFGYQAVRMDGEMYLVHRIAWLYMTGEWPPEDKMIDHIDGKPANNAWHNLRLATPAQNGQNRGRPENNTSGFKGVHRNQSNGKWCAQITANGVRHWLGEYRFPELAWAAYCEAAEKYHGEFANFGSPLDKNEQISW